MPLSVRDLEPTQVDRVLKGVRSPAITALLDSPVRRLALGLDSPLRLPAFDFLASSGIRDLMRSVAVSASALDSVKAAVNSAGQVNAILAQSSALARFNDFGTSYVRDIIGPSLQTVISPQVLELTKTLGERLAFTAPVDVRTFLGSAPRVVDFTAWIDGAATLDEEADRASAAVFWVLFFLLVTFGAGGVGAVAAEGSPGQALLGALTVADLAVKVFTYAEKVQSKQYET